MENITVKGMLMGTLTMTDRTFIYESGRKSTVIPFDRVASLSVKLPKSLLRTGLIEIHLGGGAKDFVNIGPVMTGLSDDIVIAPTIEYLNECESIRARFASYQNGTLYTATPAPSSPAPLLGSNLLTCPECGNKISRYAAACVHCGCPMEIIKENLAAEASASDAPTSSPAPVCAVAPTVDPTPAAVPSPSPDSGPAVDPIPTADGRAKCPVCGKVQRSGRGACFLCGVKFN